MTRRGCFIIGGLAVLALLLAVGPASSIVSEHDAAAAGNIFHVDADAMGTDDGTSWANAFTDLQDALAMAEAGDQIWVAEGIYRPTNGTDRAISFQMKSGVAIYGGFAGTESSVEQRDWEAHETILSGDLNGDDGPDFANNDENSYHVFYNPSELDGTAILDGFTISGGNADNGMGDGGDGGGMLNHYSSPALINITFSGNWALMAGGGMYNLHSELTLTNCTFQGNSAGAAGGGVFNSGSSLMLTNCVFEANDAYQGGGMVNGGSSPSLTNCTFSRNSAGEGGGMFNIDASSPTLTNCTFVGNYADSGAGIYNENSSPSLNNSVLWGNSPEQISNANSSPAITYSDVQGGYAGVGNIDADPLFVDPVNGDFHLSSGSPCVDAGDNSAASLPSSDFEGDDRIMDGDVDGMAIVDMGIDEIGTPTDCQARINEDTVMYTDVQSAVDAASVGDLVKVAGYCAGIQSRVGVTQTVYLSKTLTIQGGYTTTNWIAPEPASNPTTLDAQGLGRVLYVTGEISPTIEGLHITGGDAREGGGIYVSQASATIRSSSVYSNTATYGGGIFLVSSPATIDANTISGNTARDWAGGIFLQASNADLRNNVISDNTALGDAAGGLCLRDSDATLIDNVISSNQTLLSGGAMYVESSDAEIRGNILQANGAHNAVFLWHSDVILDANLITGSHTGVFMHASSPLVTNNVIADNVGSGVSVEGAWPRLVHNTLAQNSEGLRVSDRWQEGTYYTSTVVLTNTIFADQTSGVIIDSANVVSLEGTLWYGNFSNWSGDGSIITGTVNIFADPQFVDAGSGDYHIQATSAAIDAGVDSGLVEDIDGDPRPQGGGYDIGADETTSAGLGTLNLGVDLQGRADDSATIFAAWSGGEEVGYCTSDSAGTCSIAALPVGVYSVTAEMASYLDSTWDSVSISEGESVTLPTVTLLGGDTNDDCVVNIQDLAFMGYRFNACEGGPLYDVRGDINGDGCINILDLAMTGGNFNQACPVPW